MKLKVLAILMVLTLVGPLGGQASANLILNGSFEDNKGANSYKMLAAGSDWIADWTIDSGSIDLIHAYWTPSDGEYSLDLNGTTTGRISQTFDTTVGLNYIVSFDMAGNFVDGATEKSLKVGAAGVSGTYTYDRASQSSNTPKKVDDYISYSWMFTAISSVTTLFFESLETGASGPVLDNVSVTATPIPGAVWLLGSGLVGLVGLRKRIRG